MTSPQHPFDSLDAFTALPRVSGLTLSPDGTRLVTAVATEDVERTGYRTALWELDPAGQRPARRLTRGIEGEAGASFAADGTLWFTSARPVPGREEKSATLWALPERGEARAVLSRPFGVSAITCAAAGDTVLVTAPRLRGARTEAEHAALATTRADAGVDAILHTGYPVRFWDHDLGPAAPELFLLADGPDPDAAAADDDTASAEPTPASPDAASAEALSGALPGEPEHHLRHLTGFDRTHAFDLGVQLAPDGSFALVTASRAGARAELRDWVARVDTATGEARPLVDEPGMDTHAGPVSHDGARAVVVHGPHTSPTATQDPKLYLVDTDTGALTPLAHGTDLWLDPVAWLPDDSAVVAVADQDGRAPVFRIDVATGEVTQVTHGDEAWSDVVVAPDGTTAYGVRSSWLFPPEVARIDLTTGAASRLPNPAERPALPGRLERVETPSDDGTRVAGWLALPDGDAPADGHPLLLWIHGGPISSWNAWSWRWCPWLAVAQGYAVLLPDPALSTGYGRDFVQRGWGRWGEEPFTDLMAITDAAEARDDIDASRTAAMGGSFGGYMANWVAGHTDRFRAIVTHASLWNLEGFGPTTDASFYWAREMTPEMQEANSPHRHVGDIRTPMLVIHGDKDYRVPIGEGLRLWYELLSASGLPADEDGSTVHRFLYFPRENHWILAPQHTRLWYEVVLGFLAEHVLGRAPAEPPVELGLTPPAEDGAASPMVDGTGSSTASVAVRAE